jgi:hypothetical protein
MTKKIRYLPMMNINTATFTGTYQSLSAGLAEACGILHFNNPSNTNVTVSFDGVHDHEFVLAGTQVSINADLLDTCAFAEGTPVFVKGTAGVGILHLSAYYVRP